ncbi:retrovirus-related pol polyprotein from transposon TNT 1-94 [Tanacetum coccineum]
MERGFLDYSDKKKKEGGAKEDDGAIPILGDLAKRVKNIEGKTTMPKGILKKAVCNVSSDTHEVVMPLNDVGSGSKVNFEVVDLATNEELSGDAATNIDKPSSSSGAQRTMGSEQEVFTSNDERVESVDCVLPKAAAAKVKSRYENSIVGFFVGKDPSFLVVQQYVSNTWRKFGFEKITRNDDGVYLFKFASKSGMDQVLEKRPWMIRKSPIIFNKWSPSVSLKKGEVTKVPFGKRLEQCPVLMRTRGWIESCLTTQIGKPIILIAFYLSLCIHHGMNRVLLSALIEISAHSVLKKEVTMAISDEEGDGYTKEVIRVCVRMEATTLSSPSVSTNDNEKGNGCLKLDLNLSNPFDVLNVEWEEMGHSGQQPKVSEHVGTESLNVNKKKAQEPSSSKSAINDVHKDKNVMAISVISISSDSLEESVGTSTAQVILFGTIPTAISATVPIVDLPIAHDDTTLIPIETPTISHVVSTLPHTSPFMYTDSSDSDISDRPPSHDPYEVTVARWRSRVAARLSLPSPPTLCQILPAPPGLPRRLAIFVLQGQLIPVGQPYHTRPNGVRKMLIARKSVGPLPSHRLALRYSQSHSPSDHFSPDDFSSDTLLGSSSGYSLDYSSDTSSGHSIPDSSFDSPAASFADIDADTAVAEAATAREADARVGVDTRIDREDEVEEEAEFSHRGTVEIGVDKIVEPVELHDHLEEIPVRRIRVIEGVQRDQGHRMLATSQQSVVMSDRIDVLKRDNMRLSELDLELAPSCLINRDLELL